MAPLCSRYSPLTGRPSWREVPGLMLSVAPAPSAESLVEEFVEVDRPWLTPIQTQPHVPV